MFLRNRLYSLLVAAVMSAPVAALASPSYTISFLPDGFDANFLGNNGLVAGSILTGSGTAGAIYQNGNLAQYDSLGIINIASVNSNGMFTGALQTTGMSKPHAFIYQDGAVQDLGIFNGEQARGIAINDAGQMAGDWVGHNIEGGFLYSGGAITQMGTLGGSSHTWVNAINEAGVVVGASMPLNGTNHAYMYSGGVMTDLGTTGYFGSDAYAINNKGEIVGYIWDWGQSGPAHAFLYTGGVLHDLGTFGGTSARARGISDSGLVVGFVGTASGSFGFLYDSGTAWNLNTLVSGADGWTISGASAINESGQILASACNYVGACRDVVLDPVSAVPEPEAYAMLLAGLVALTGRRRFGQRRKAA